MIKLAMVALGGALGSMGRYLLTLALQRQSGSSFSYPVETLTANLIGCLLIGVLWGLFERVSISNEFRLFLFTGLLGGFTTFSAFARENVQLLRAGEPLQALLYIALSNGFGIGLALVGFVAASRFFHSIG
jgi:CrcB protein